MMRRMNTMAVALATWGLAETTRAQVAAPTTAPAAAVAMANVPPASTTRPVVELESAANAAFDRGDYASALPMYQDLSVRLREQPEVVAPLLEKVRICERNLADAQTQVIEGINAPRTPHPAPASGRTYDVALQKLGNFAYDAEKGGGIPADVQALHGATIRTHGFMIPIDQSEKITKFVLVPSLFACCFGQPPAVQHTVMIATPPGKAVSYFAEQIDVTGTLRVQERKEDGFVMSVFELDATSIKPSPAP